MTFLSGNLDKVEHIEVQKPKIVSILREHMQTRKILM